MFLLLFGLVSTFTLIVINVVWLTSVHVIGINTIAPELNHVCIELNIQDKTIRCNVLYYYSPHKEHNLDRISTITSLSS